MINIHVPMAGRPQYYARVDTGTMLWGPLSLDNKPVSQTIPARSPSDTLLQGEGMHGENDVSHHKLEGDIYYNPIMSRTTVDPSWLEDYPDHFRLLQENGQSVFFLHGMAQPCSVQRNVDSKQYRFLISECSSTQMVTYQCGGRHTNGVWTELNIGRVTYTVIDKHPSYTARLRYRIRRESSILRSDALGGITFEDTRQLAKVISAFSRGDQSVLSDIASYVDMIVFNKPPVGTLSISSLMKNFLPTIIPQLVHETDGLEHYGDLADRAVSKMNRTSSNMLEFLSELRKPKALIPKLKNLKTLKGYSEEHLRLNYGILPTVSDLQNTVNMFKGKKPYFDKNGFQTYHSGDSDSQFSSTGFITRSRQMKVAVQYENKDLIDLMSRVEEFGLLPNASNLWDLVPFSFVLDWFVDVGGFLERIDMSLRISRLDIPYVTMSEKVTSSVTIPRSRVYPVHGELTTVSYQRWTSRHCPTPPLLQGNKSNTPPRSHWIEAGALIVANSK